MYVVGLFATRRTRTLPAGISRRPNEKRIPLWEQDTFASGVSRGVSKSAVVTTSSYRKFEQSMVLLVEKRLRSAKAAGPYHPFCPATGDTTTIPSLSDVSAQTLDRTEKVLSTDCDHGRAPPALS